MSKAVKQRQHGFGNRFTRWLFTPPKRKGTPTSERIDWVRGIPFIMMHVMCLAVFWVGFSWPALVVAGFLYALRVFALTGFYHRYFSHRAFKQTRFCQFVFGALGCSAVQRGPLWWAAHHRHHHVHSDDEHDLHSPRRQGFLWSHFGWFLTPKALPTNMKLIPDYAKYPELRLLDRFEVFIPVFLAVCLFLLGVGLDSYFPGLGTSGMQMLVWGFFISTVAVYHVTYLVNSATHLIGSRRYETKDDSRNNIWIALLTFGEGWHNNHHHYPNSARQGFFWWEVDITYYCLRALSWVGLVWDLRPVPAHMLHPREAVPAQEVPALDTATPAPVLTPLLPATPGASAPQPTS